jgi:hypothetical protein
MQILTKFYCQLKKLYYLCNRFNSLYSLFKKKDYEKDYDDCCHDGSCN